MKNNIIDLKFNIKQYSFIIAQIILEKTSYGEEDEFNSEKIRYETYPFYNGRESSIALTFINEPEMVKSDSIRHIIVFGECRNSDYIFVDYWFDNKCFAQPSINDFTEEQYKNRKYFEYDEYSKAADYIISLIQEKI